MNEQTGAPTEEQRAAFLGAPYGPPGGRFRLSPVPTRPDEAPAWTRDLERWALLTAWNPGGERRGEDENRAAQARLCAGLRAQGFSPLPALNGEGEWEEPSYLIPGATLAQVRAWAGAFGQVAALYGEGGRAALVWTAGGEDWRWARALPGIP